jgi:hypothetical protein
VSGLASRRMRRRENKQGRPWPSASSPESAAEIEEFTILRVGEAASPVDQSSCERQPLEAPSERMLASRVLVPFTLLQSRPPCEGDLIRAVLSDSESCVLRG